MAVVKAGVTAIVVAICCFHGLDGRRIGGPRGMGGRQTLRISGGVCGDDACGWGAALAGSGGVAAKGRMRWGPGCFPALAAVNVRGAEKRKNVSRFEAPLERPVR